MDVVKSLVFSQLTATTGKWGLLGVGGFVVVVVVIFNVYFRLP